jgi:hypothetical protein
MYVEENKLRSSSLCNFLHFAVTPSPLILNILQLFSNTTSAVIQEGINLWSVQQFMINTWMDGFMLPSNVPAIRNYEHVGEKISF